MSVGSIVMAVFIGLPIVDTIFYFWFDAARRVLRRTRKPSAPTASPSHPNPSEA